MKVELSFRAKITGEIAVIEADLPKVVIDAFSLCHGVPDIEFAVNVAGQRFTGELFDMQVPEYGQDPILEGLPGGTKWHGAG